MAVSTNARTMFITGPMIRTWNRSHLFFDRNSSDLPVRGSSGFSPAILTYPPSGSAPIPYSVSPRRKLTIVGLNPSWNFRTRIPIRLAARKWPSSCTNTRTPKTKANDKSVVKTQPSDFQLYPACEIPRKIARPLIDFPDRLQTLHLNRRMRIHRRLDNLRNAWKGYLAIEKPGNGDLVCGVQDDRQATFGSKRPVRQPQAGKPLVIGQLELEPAGACKIEHRQRRGPPIRIREGVLNRQPHVRHPELRNDRSVNQLDHRMHH